LRAAHVLLHFNETSVGLAGGAYCSISQDKISAITHELLHDIIFI